MTNVDEEKANSIKSGQEERFELRVESPQSGCNGFPRYMLMGLIYCLYTTGFSQVDKVIEHLELADQSRLST